MAVGSAKMEEARVDSGAAGVVAGSDMEEVAAVAEAEADATWCGCAKPKMAGKTPPT